MTNKPIIYKFFKDSTKEEFLAVGLSQTFLNTGTADETFQQSEKKDSLRHILKSLGSMYESSSKQFFRTAPGIQLGPDPFHESRLFMTFLTNLGILCSFILVLKRKTAKETPESSRLDFLEKFLANNFALSDIEGNTSKPLNIEDIENYLC